MRTMLAIAALTALSLPALGQEPDIADACAAAAAHFYHVDQVEWSEPQAFPELSPPRVQIRVKIPEGAPVPGAIGRIMFGAAAPEEQETYIVKCEFERSDAPFGLTVFTPPPGSFGMPEGRLEELQVLLAREGY